jgi:RimJ/RimL family protein N-acetyltransferase
MLIYGQDDRLLPWAAERIGVPSFRDDARAIGIVDGERIRGVVVYDCFGLCDLNMHVASDGSRRWLTREFLAHVFAYPFVQLGMRRVTALVPARNVAALQFDRKLGFCDEGYFRHAMPDDDIVALGMLREDCRFIPKEYRQ